MKLKFLLGKYENTWKYLWFSVCAASGASEITQATTAIQSNRQMEILVGKSHLMMICIVLRLLHTAALDNRKLLDFKLLLNIVKNKNFAKHFFFLLLEWRWKWIYNTHGVGMETCGIFHADINSLSSCDVEMEFFPLFHSFQRRVLQHCDAHKYFWMADRGREFVLHPSRN